MSDFDAIPGMRKQWSDFMSQCFEDTIAIESGRFVGDPPWKPQYYNATKTDAGATLEQEIPWNAFSKELIRRYGRERALREADTLWPLSRYGASWNGAQAATTFYHPLTEYCEWHVVRDPQTNAIRRVTFTSEPPEYWQALFGDAAGLPSGNAFKFTVPDQKKLLALYHELVSDEVTIEDLTAQHDIELSPGANGFTIKAGQYNFYNKWNTTLGIAHLSAPPNSLAAEVQLGGDATVLRMNRAGRHVIEADPLICCAQYGGPDRNSDPTIGGTVNALARAGALITLRNPVGLYMDHIDLSGWALPEGIDPKDCVRVVRGDADKRMIERLVVEVPSETGYSISDITIGAEPIRYGGQIAECITVKLVGIAALAGIVNEPLKCTGRCCVDPANLRMLNRPKSYEGDDGPILTPLGMIDAFTGEGLAPAAGVTGRDTAPHTRAMRAV